MRNPTETSSIPTDGEQPTITVKSKTAKRFRLAAQLTLAASLFATPACVTVATGAPQQAVQQPTKSVAKKGCYSIQEKDEQALLEAVRKDIRALECVDDSLRQNPAFMLSVLKEVKAGAVEALYITVRKGESPTQDLQRKFNIFTEIHRLIPDSLAKDRDFILDAMEISGAIVFKGADASLKKDKQFVLAAMKVDGLIFDDIDESLKNDKEVVLASLETMAKEMGKLNLIALQGVDESLTLDKDFMLDAMRVNGMGLKNAPEVMKQDEEVVLAAVGQDYFAFYFADDALKKAKAVCLKAARIDGRVLELVDDSLKRDKDVVLAAVKENPFTLHFAHVSMRNDKDVVLAAVSQNGMSLRYAGASLKKDIEVVLTAVRNAPYAINYADESLKNHPVLVRIAKEKPVPDEGSEVQVETD